MDDLWRFLFCFLSCSRFLDDGFGQRELRLFSPEEKKIEKNKIFGTTTTSINKDWEDDVTKSSFKYIYIINMQVYIHICIPQKMVNKHRCILQNCGQWCKNNKLQSCTLLLLLLLLYIQVLHLLLHNCIYV